MTESLYNKINSRSEQGQKQLAVLIDPDKFHSTKIIELANETGVDYLFVGGSLLTSGSLDATLESIKKITSIPIILFPGSVMQISNKADALMFLSLISGRNPELLIGQHVIAAPALKASGLEILPTGYILVDGGKPTTASYISNTLPVPSDKPEIASCTALAGEMLGLKLIYLDAGSGAIKPVSSTMIAQVKNTVKIPLIVGGGINTPEAALQACSSGADVVVVGNALEKKPKLLQEISSSVHNSVLLSH